MSEEKKLSANEYIKTRSNYLRGTIKEGLADLATGSMCEEIGRASCRERV